MPTLLGNPTFEELDELIAAKDATITAITEESAKVLPAWRASAAGEADAWDAAWTALRARYNAARALRVHAPTTLAVPPEVVWHAVLKSIRQAWDVTGPLTQAAPESPGDLQDLSRRLGAQGGKPDFSKVPQPVATDPSLEIFKAADVLTRGLPSFGGGLLFLAIFWLLGRR